MKNSYGPDEVFMEGGQTRVTDLGVGGPQARYNNLEGGYD